MDKQIQFCTATELLSSLDLNKSEMRFLKTIDVINSMYDYLKSQPTIKGHELELLNVSFEQVKPKLARDVLETIVHIKN